MATSALIITDYNVKIIPIEQKVFNCLCKDSPGLDYIHLSNKRNLLCNLILNLLCLEMV